MNKTRKLNDKLFYNGVQDESLRTFDIIMHTEFGTTYNSYTLIGSEKTAIIECAKDKFWDDFVQGVSKWTDISKIDYLIVNHTEPDHSGSIGKLLELNPEITVVGTMGAIGFLKNIINRDFKSITVKNGDTLSLGDVSLEFMFLPNLHWPDTMYTYWKEEKILFTCDSFGAHYCFDGLLYSEIKNHEDYEKSAKYYYDCIIGPFVHPFLDNALKKIQDYDIKMICPGHGPILDDVKRIRELYKQWSVPKEKKETPLVTICYVSAYGYTKKLCEKIDETLRASQVDTVVFDMTNTNTQTAVESILNSDGVLLGTPTILGDALKPIWDILTHIPTPLVKGKIAAAFGSYGWSGEGVPNITSRLKQLKFDVSEGLKVCFCPSEENLCQAETFAKEFIQKIK